MHDVRSIGKVLDRILRSIMNPVPDIPADRELLEIIPKTS